MTMTISTRSFYDRSASAMMSLTAAADRLNTEVSTGKRLLAPSDDSAGWQRLQGLMQAKGDATVDSANVKIAQSVLAQGDTTLKSMTDLLTTAQELAVQAGDGTLSTDAKKAIGEQLQGVLDSIVSLANTKDARGMPLFGGAGDGAAVTQQADGSLRFASGEGSAIPIGDGQTVQPGTNAKNFLKVGDGDIGTVLTAMITALNAGGTIPDGSADDLKTVSDQTISAQASLGARAARVDIIAGQQVDAAADREIARKDIEDIDVTQTITDLQKTMTILSATQASFSKLNSLSLFDYLR